MIVGDGTGNRWLYGLRYGAVTFLDKKMRVCPRRLSFRNRTITLLFRSKTHILSPRLIRNGDGGDHGQPRADGREHECSLLPRSSAQIMEDHVRYESSRMHQ